MNMKFFVVCAFLLVAKSASENANEYCKNEPKLCYSDCLKDVCVALKGANETIRINSIAKSCNGKYGGMEDGKNHLLEELQEYANLHIRRSFHYLLVSTYFGNYIKNREGFEKLFHKLSDDTWNDGIEIIKHIAKRGGKHDFTKQMSNIQLEGDYVKNELQAMANAVDVQKHLAETAFDIHRTASGHHKEHKDSHSLYDPEIAHYMEEEFIEKQADTLRNLVGHVTDLRKLLLVGGEGSLSLHLFDEYLQKA